MTNSILRLPAALECTGLSRSTIYLRVSEDKFPRSISLGGRAVGRREPEIDEWLDACVTARGGGRSEFGQWAAGSLSIASGEFHLWMRRIWRSKGIGPHVVCSKPKNAPGAYARNFSR